MGQKLYHGTSKFTGCFAFFNIVTRLMIRSRYRVSFDDFVCKYSFILIYLGKFLSIISNIRYRFVLGHLIKIYLLIHRWWKIIRIRRLIEILGTPVYVNRNIKQVLCCKKITYLISVNIINIKNSLHWIDEYGEVKLIISECYK